jgi:flagellar basal body-associated protein FliL
LRFNSVHSVFVRYNAVVVEKTPSPASSSKRSRRLKTIGVIVLVLGLGSAGLVYWLGTRSPDVMDDLSMLGFNKAQSRQMGILYGKMGLFTEDLLNDLKRPGTQATIITAVSILIAAGCFYFSRMPDNDDEAADGIDSHHG